MSLNQSEILRPVANFPVDIWGDRFCSYAMDKQMYDLHAKEIEVVKDEVRQMLIATGRTVVERLCLVDNLERLGIAYHFEREIEQQLEEIFKLVHVNNFDDYIQSYDDLFSAALLFRLLRQHHFSISCGIFDKFVEANGEFKESLSSDIKGLLCLYEAAQVRTRGDSILEEALAFATFHLKREPLEASSTLAKQVKRALKQPLHRGSPRIEAYHYISVYEEDKSHDPLLLKFAKMDFNLLQMLHKQELAEVLRWANDLDIASKVPYSRVRAVESYFCSVGMFFEPQYSPQRINLAKTAVLITIINDTYDAYGTIDELKVFTDVIERWDANEMDRLPDSMRTCHDVLLNYTDGLHNNELARLGRSFGSDSYKEEWKIYTKSQYIESRWFISRELPAFPDYFSNGLITGFGCMMLIKVCWLDMKSATRDVFDWLSVTNRPKILVACATMCRLKNDVGSYKVEKERGGGTGIECYMKHYKVSEEEAMKKLEEMVEEAWKDLNEEWLNLRPGNGSGTLSRDVLMTILHLARLTDVLYEHREDGFTDPHKNVEDYMVALLVHPLIV